MWSTGADRICAGRERTGGTATKYQAWTTILLSLQAKDVSVGPGIEHILLSSTMFTAIQICKCKNVPQAVWLSMVANARMFHKHFGCLWLANYVINNFFLGGHTNSFSHWSCQWQISSYHLQRQKNTIHIKDGDPTSRTERQLKQGSQGLKA